MAKTHLSPSKPNFSSGKPAGRIGFGRAPAILVGILSAFLALQGVADETSVDPEVVGMSAERLERLDLRLREMIDQERLAGCVTLVLRNDKPVHFSALGYRDKEAESPMRKDTLFRIASQTKAIVSTAVMILQEEGRLAISDPVGRYLPEFMETTVARLTDEGYEVVPANRPITIRDLLMHTSGVGYGRGPGEELWEEAGIQDWYFADRDEPIREVVRRMATLPFQGQPGEEWIYGYSTDILGALVEVVSGDTLDAFLKSRIFDPVGMQDTHFFLPKEKAGRLAAVYSVENEELVRAPEDGRFAQGAYVEGPRKCFSGGAGLISSAHDYAAFLQMIADNGLANGNRVLARKSVELMRTNHLRTDSMPGNREGRGFGLGFGIVTNVGQRGELGSPGEYGWGGAYHSAYWIDPVEDLIVVYLTQVIPADGLNDINLVRNLIYQAIVD